MNFVTKAMSERDEFLADSLDLFSGARGGHTGKWCWSDGGLWTAFAEHSPFYHVFNEECGLFALNADIIADKLRLLNKAVDIGAGSPMAFERKLLPVLARMPTLRSVASIDIVDEFPRASAEILERWRPDVAFTPLRADFYQAMPKFNQPVAAFFLGSAISQVVLGKRESLTTGIERMLNHISTALPHGSMLVMSYDSCQDRGKLLRAYDHPSLNAMELSIITRMQRELGMSGASVADFAITNEWREDRHLLMKNLKPQQNLSVTLSGQEFRLWRGLQLWNASCYKPTPAIFAAAVRGTPFKQKWAVSGPNMHLAILEKG